MRYVMLVVCVLSVNMFAMEKNHKDTRKKIECVRTSPESGRVSVYDAKTGNVVRVDTEKKSTFLKLPLIFSQEIVFSEGLK
jgi:hypothetical protein